MWLCDEVYIDTAYWFEKKVGVPVTRHMGPNGPMATTQQGAVGRAEINCDRIGRMGVVWGVSSITYLYWTKFF